MGAKMTDVNLLIQAGINPKTGLPYKLSSDCGLEYNLKPEIKKAFRIMDEQNAVNRYTWYNLPSNLDSQLLERILYYKGQGAFFYLETNDQFYFLPYTLAGNIDVYGRFLSITPIPFAGGTTTPDGKDKPWIQGLTFNPQYSPILPSDLTYEDLTDKCVLLSDYTKQISQTVLPRQALQEPLLDLMSDCLPFCRTALLNGTGIQGMRVESEDEQSNVDAASRSVNNAALNGKKWVPIVGHVDFQDLTTSNAANSEQFLLTLQSVDNLRLSLLGLDNGGVFQKRERKLVAEAEQADNNVGLILQDGLTNRQNFCNIINSIWGLGVWCEISETQSYDRNGDGVLQDTQTPSTTPNQTTEQEVIIDDMQ